MRKLFIFIFSLLWFASFANANDVASISGLEAFQMRVEPQNKQFVWIKFGIASGYYLYQDKISIKNSSDSEVKLGRFTLPDPIIVNSELNESVAVYENNLAIQVPIENYANGILHVIVSYQGCKGTSLCLPASSLDQTIDLNSGKLLASQAISPPVATDTPNRVVDYFAGSTLTIILGFFALGLLIAFTPCVFPLLPILFAIISNKSVNLWRGFVLALSYIIGGATVYAGAGLIAVLIGSSLSNYLQSAGMSIVITIIFIIFALSMYDLFELKLPNAIQSKLTDKINSLQGMSIISTFVIGGLSNLILSPCVTAPLASALLYISSSKNYWLGGGALFALGLGSGVPLLVIALFGKRFLPKSGNWMIFTKRILAIVMIAMAGYTLSQVFFDYDDIILAIVLAVIVVTLANNVKLITSNKFLVKVIFVLGVIGAILLYREYSARKMLGADSGFNKVTQIVQLDNYINLAHQQHKPIIIDFYANWCSACREMDLRTFSNQEVKNALTNFELIRIDSTNNTADIRQIQNKYNIYALPAIIILYPDGSIADGFQTYGFLNSADFIAKLSKFNQDLSQVCVVGNIDKRC